MGVDDILIQAALEALKAMQDADSLLDFEGLNPRCEDEIKALKAALSPFLLTREKVLQEFFGASNVMAVTGCDPVALLQTALPRTSETFVTAHRMAFELAKDVIFLVAPLHKGNLTFWLGILDGIRNKMT